jgi:AcrR family transcriptional regulator
MQQGEKSQRSRAQILNAALKLFSHHGYGATSVQDIAEKAKVSKGNVYHHFPDKETIFRALLDRYFQAMAQPDFPFNRALGKGLFPDNLEEMGRATREVVEQYREYVALIYVDVVEFDASHVRKFYQEMSTRFDAFLDTHGMEEEIQSRLAPELSPTSAVMLATRVFFQYFSIEILFGVKEHFGKSTDEVIGEISRILRHGMLRNGTAATKKRGKPKKRRRTPSSS